MRLFSSAPAEHHYQLPNGTQRKTTILPKIASIVAAGALSASLFAAEFSGAVTDESTGSPIEGAIVRLLGQELTDTTDSNGIYNFEIPETPIQTMQLPQAQSVSVIQNGYLQFNLSGKKEILIEAFTMNGRRIAQKTLTMSAGTQQIAPLVSAPGVYIYRINVDGKQFARRFSYTHNSGSPAFSQGISTLRSRAASSETEDTLRVTKPGYYSTEVEVNFATTPEAISLSEVDLTNGVQSGEWAIASGRDTLGTIFVNENGTTIDSLHMPIEMSCIRIHDDHVATVQGPFEIPSNGVVESGDSLFVVFTEDKVYGNFITNKAYSKYSSETCSWTEVYLTGGGGKITKLVTHNDHFFQHTDPTAFTSEFFTLNIEESDYGTVTYSPKNRYFRENEKVTITAVPVETHHFSSWDGISSSEKSVELVMGESRTVKANFAPNFRLTTDVTNGVAGRTPQKQSYAPGDTVLLIGYPDTSYITANWSGDTLRTAGDSAWVVMDDHKTVDLNFTKVYMLFTEDDDSGSVTVVDEKPYYAEGTSDTVMLLGNPNDYYEVASWGGDTLKTHYDTAWVVMDSTKTVSVEFRKAASIYRVQNNCTITSETGKFYANSWDLDTIMLIAVPDSGYQFGYWSSNTVNADQFMRSSGDTCWVYMDRSHQIEATASSAAAVTRYITSGESSRLAFVEGEDQVLIGSDLYDNGTGEKTGPADLTQFKLNSYKTVYSSDGTVRANYEDSVLTVVRDSDNEIINSFDDLNLRYTDMALSSDGSILAALYGDTTLKVLNVATGELLHTVDSIPGIFTMKFVESDAKLLFYTDGPSMESYINELTIATGNHVSTKIQVLENCSDFSDDGTKLVVGTWNRGLQVFDTKTGTQLRKFDDHGSPIMNTTFNSEGTEVLTIDMDGYTLRHILQ